MDEIKYQEKSLETTKKLMAPIVSGMGSDISNGYEITPQKRPFNPSPSNDLENGDGDGDGDGALSNSQIEHIRSDAAHIEDYRGEISGNPSTGSISGPYSPSISLSLTESNSGRKGLNNLGNTCFMNSALQCLSATSSLTSYFLRGEWENELNTSNPLGMEGLIPKAYANLIENLWLSNLHTSSYAPREFKYIIGQRNPTFVGYGQQDSHVILAGIFKKIRNYCNHYLTAFMKI